MDLDLDKHFLGATKVATALALAAKQHHKQMRKSPAVPYIIHPVRVMMVLHRYGVTDSDILAAALLHDTVEDTDLTVADIFNAYGKRVSDFVADVTEQKMDGNKKRPWKMRKQYCISMVRHGMHWPSVAIKLADQIDNMSSTAMAQRAHYGGNVPDDTLDFWVEFGGNAKSQYWYSAGIYMSAVKRLSLEDVCENGLRAKIRDMTTEIRELLWTTYGELAATLPMVTDTQAMD